MTLKEILEIDGLKNVHVHPFFNNLGTPEKQPNLDEMFTKQEALPLIQYDNDIIGLSISLQYDSGSYFVTGGVTLKDNPSNLLSINENYDHNNELINNELMVYLSDLGLENQTVENGISLGNNRNISSMGAIHIYSSNGYFELNDQIENYWEKLLIQEVGVASIGLSAMYDLINKIMYDKDSNMAKKIQQHFNKNIGDYSTFSEVKLLRTEDASTGIKKKVNKINQTLYNNTKSTISQ